MAVFVPDNNTRIVNITSNKHRATDIILQFDYYLPVFAIMVGLQEVLEKSRSIVKV